MIHFLKFMLLSIRLFNLFCDRTSEFVCLFVLIFRSFFWSFSFSFYHKLPLRCFFLNTFEFCLILKKNMLNWSKIKACSRAIQMHLKNATMFCWVPHCIIKLLFCHKEWSIYWWVCVGVLVTVKYFFLLFCPFCIHGNLVHSFIWNHQDSS